MSLNLSKIRHETPATQHLIHFNNAGAALSPVTVSAAVIAHLQREQEIGGYEAAAEAHTGIENFYSAFSTMLGCSPNEIAYAENATSAWNKLFSAIPFEPGQSILTGQSEYASNYMAFLHLAKHKGVNIKVIPNTESGVIDLQLLEQAINTNVKLIALTHVPSQSGTIHPAQEVGLLARKHNILYLLDACQSAGQMQLNVDTLGCDMLTGTGRKYLRGPRGTGFIYLRQSAVSQLEPTEIDMHSATWTGRDTYTIREDARKFESFECFVAGKIGLGVAVDYALQLGLDNIETRVQSLAQQLRDSLVKIPNVQVHDQGHHLSGIVTFNKKGYNADALQAHLRTHNANTSVARRGNNQLDFVQRNLEDLNRASVHYYNTEEEIERFCSVVKAL